MKNILLNNITFALPTRQFVVTSSVTVNESLPKVTEFVLRLIRLCEGVSPEEVRGYFGFTGKETRLILESLRDQSLIHIEDGLVRLTDYAESKFYTDDDLPRFSVVKERVDSVDFDLLTFHPIDGRRAGKAPAYASELDVSDEKIATSARLAEQAYQTHFQRILKMRERGNDKIDIYKISNVQTKDLCNLPLEVNFELDGNLSINRLVAYDEDASQSFRLGVETAVSDAMHRPLAMQAAYLEEFIERFDDKLIGQFYSKKGFEFERYIKDVFIDKTITYSGATIPILGNLYMPENQKTIQDWLRISMEDNVAESAMSFTTSIAWLAPDYKFWGRTGLLDDLYFKLSDALHQHKKPKKQAVEHVHLLCPGSKELMRTLKQQFWSKKEKSVHFFSEEVVGGKIEVIFLPTRMACVLFHFSPPGNSSALIPFGFITRSPELVKEAQVILHEAMGVDGNGYVGKATYNNGEGPPPRYVDQFGFINYCAIR